MQGDLLQQLLCPEKNYYDLAALANPQRVELKIHTRWLDAAARKGYAPSDHPGGQAELTR